MNIIKYKNNEIIKKKTLNLIVNESKRFLRWKKENNRIYNLYKEYILTNYEYENNFFYLKYLDNCFLKILNFKFNITKTMKIKVFLWISPSIIKNKDSIIEIKSLTERMNILLMDKMKFKLWKVFK